MKKLLLEIRKHFSELMGILSIEELVSNYELIKQLMKFNSTLGKF